MLSLQGREATDGSRDPSQEAEETRRDTEGSRARETSHEEGTARVTHVVAGCWAGTRDLPTLEWWLLRNSARTILRIVTY